MRTSESINEIAEALAKAQAEMKQPTKKKTAKVQGTSKSGNPYNYNYQYADISDVIECILPSLTKHGLSVVQATSIDGGALILNTRLCHSSGQWFEADYPVCHIGSDHQSMGGAMTYARRYALSAMVGVAPDEDKDGESAANSAAPKSKPIANAYDDVPSWEEVERSILKHSSLEWLEKMQGKVLANSDKWPQWLIDRAMNLIKEKATPPDAAENNPFDEGFDL